MQLADIVLAAGRVISGRVVDETGTPVNACRVMASPSAGRQVSGGSDTDGRFHFANIPPGPVTVWTNRRDAVNAGQRIEQAGDVDITLVLHEGVWVDVTMHDADGKPVQGLVLFGFPLAHDDPERLGESLAMPRQGGSGADGHVRLGPFAPGPVRVSEPSKSFIETVVNAPCSVDLVLPAPTEYDVALLFLDAATRKPVRATGTLSARWGDDVYSGAVSDLQVTPDKLGEWTFARDIASGTAVRLTFAFNGFEPAVLEHVPSTVDQATPLEVLLKREAGVLVRVADADGAPVSGAAVTLLWGVEPARARSLRQSFDGDAPQSADYSGFGKLAAYRQPRTSGADGLARFTRIGDGPVAWLVTASGFAPVVGQRDLLPPGNSHAAGEEIPNLVVTLTAVNAAAAAEK